MGVYIILFVLGFLADSCWWKALARPDPQAFFFLSLFLWSGQADAFVRVRTGAGASRSNAPAPIVCPPCFVHCCREVCCYPFSFRRELVLHTFCFRWCQGPVIGQDG